MSCNLCPLHCLRLYCNDSRCVKGSAVHNTHHQCLVAECLGVSVTVRARARARARAREWDFCPFLSVLRATKTFILYVKGSCNVHGVRTTTECDVMMMYCKEQYVHGECADCGDSLTVYKLIFT